MSYVTSLTIVAPINITLALVPVLFTWTYTEANPGESPLNNDSMLVVGYYDDDFPDELMYVDAWNIDIRNEQYSTVITVPPGKTLKSSNDYIIRLGCTSKDVQPELYTYTEKSVSIFNLLSPIYGPPGYAN